METPDPSPLAPPAGARGPRLPWDPVWKVLGAVLVVVALAAGAAGLLRAPYVVYAPGSAIDTAPAIEVPGQPVYDSEGSVLFLTVSLRGASDRRRANYWEGVYGWLRGDIDVYPRRLVLGDRSGAENRQESLQMMAASQEVAAKVALEHLGHEVGVEGTGALVAGFADGAPVADVLGVGDVIVALDGEPVTLDSELRSRLAGRAPGDEVTLEVEPGGVGPSRTVTTELIAAPEGDRALLGVTVYTRDFGYVLPFPVQIDTADIGGPSAGLALTLGLLDRLTPGDLTGGAEVAVTGSINADGTVGEVGGVAQKAVAARRAGARLMLVPASEAHQARPHAGAMEVVGVETLDDALRALAAIGGEGPGPAAGAG